MGIMGDLRSRGERLEKTEVMGTGEYKRIYLPDLPGARITVAYFISAVDEYFPGFNYKNIEVLTDYYNGHNTTVCLQHKK